MARIRTIKPEFWTDPKIVALPVEARLLFVGMLNFSDDHGYQPDEPLRIKMQVFPGDNFDVGALLELVVQAGLVSRVVSSDGSNWLHVIKFSKHQKVNHPQPSKFIPGTFPERSRNVPGTFPPEGKGREGNGIEGNGSKSGSPEKSTHRANSDELGKEKTGPAEENGVPEQTSGVSPPLAPPKKPAPVGRFAPPGGLLGGILSRAAAGKPQPAERHHRSPEEREERGQIQRATGPWKELSPLARGEFKQPLKCPKCGHLTDYFPHRDGDRYNSEVWICSKDSGGCGSKFKGAQWEDREGKLTPKRSKGAVHIDPNRKAQLTVLPKYREYLEPEEDGPHVEVPRV
jgi:ribosomal protein L37AE/L43A